MLLFESKGWEDYLYWQATDKKKLQRINELIKDCLRTPLNGRGKPEPLKGNLQGYWSRRIDDEHRLVYTYRNGTVVVIACRYHY